MLQSIAHRSTAELGGPLSVLVRQRRDHERLDALLERLQDTAGADQDRVLADIYRLVFPHAFAEEAVLWPVMRRVLPDGEALTLEVEREHQEVNELVSRLDALGHDDPERDAIIYRLIEVLRDDVRDEEDELFPRLRAELGDSRLRLLGLSWELLRRTAPTRAHPIVSRRPPGNVVSALPLSLLDRSRDLAERVARGGPAWARRPAGSVVAGLGRAARGVEHLPIMRRGEHRSTRRGSSARVPVASVALGVAGIAAVVLVVARARSRRG